ncbi:MAG: helix-turn-helix domain-containing protein [Planctomycetota bacterium]|nr:helix-turn-helix domain-containing protein [Planctomycetota bacterium]
MAERKDGKKKTSRIAKTRLPFTRCYGLKEAAQKVLGVPLNTLRTWIAKGHIARVKAPGLRGRVLIREDDLADFMDRFREPAVSGIRDELHQAETAPKRSKGRGKKNQKHPPSPNKPTNEPTTPQNGGPE